MKKSSKHVAILGLGSNLGDREANLKVACGEFDVVKCSKIYETEPYGVTAQPKFLNMVCVVLTDLDPRGLLEFCKDAEGRIGRVERERWGPREIDIDILFYDDKVLDEPDLKIPHVGIAKRRFVLEPLAEIVPGFVHPENGLAVEELLDNLG